MSCGGLNLVTGCCGNMPGTNAHESYKGSSFSPPISNYATQRNYEHVELPHTQPGRSYAVERVYSPIEMSRPLERIYLDQSRRFNPDQSSPERLNIKSSEQSLDDKALELLGELKQEAEMKNAYARQHEALNKLEDVYAKQRILNLRINQALNTDIQLLRN
jgi:hypothetical protein